MMEGNEWPQQLAAPGSQSAKQKEWKMRRKSGFLVAGLVFAAMAAPAGVQAKSQFLDVFNARYGTTGTRLDNCKVCHTTVPSLNSYGSAFKASWKSGLTPGKALGAIRPLDSDKDTFTNIQEIRARTFPGRKADHP
jgi:hypothetical protein